MSQVDGNYTRVSEFFIVGFPSLQPQYFHIVAWFFFFLYVTTVVGNLLLVLVFALEQSLQKPMYIVMVSLALSDIGFATVSLPKLIARYWWNDGSLGFYTCIFQQHMIHYFGSLASLILLIMALDRYLAICFPLRYPMLMTNQIMRGLILLCWVVAHIFPSITTIGLVMMQFCGPNRIIHGFCNHPSLSALACGDGMQQMSAAYSVAMFVLYVPFSFIIFSYICIIISVLRIDSGQGRMKTFSTCATQGCIISIYYIPRFFVYSTPFIPNLKMTPDKNIVTVLFYSLFPPLINPFIYCLRTNEIRKIIRLWVKKQKGISPKHMSQVDGNYTRVSQFFIVGFPSLQPQYFHIVAWFFFFLYVTTVVGNLLLVLVFALEQSLQKPMYIVMVSLALSDIGFTTVALPKAIARYWWNHGSLGFHTCIFQQYMIHYFGSVNSLVLFTMALDRYLAICFPLRYPLLMTTQTMTRIILFCWLMAQIFPSITAIKFTLMVFCEPNQITNIFCDHMSLIAVACEDTDQVFKLGYFSAMLILYVPLAFIVFSYVCIVISVLRMARGQGRMKTFSTCATQGCIISIYYIPRFVVYSTPYFPN
ncbi:hypothetical protein Q5P01_019333 [Channa striata]|uniref:G-protein coupled receptors family 1 profile domain-containing protein n=1 Tax=Channa striata TaxID=64152 RepID=A0AA88SDL2_CHASR|nr:hypothetical protein Q5P01_019333 [Channa striata]